MQDGEEGIGWPNMETCIWPHRSPSSSSFPLWPSLAFDCPRLYWQQGVSVIQGVSSYYILQSGRKGPIQRKHFWGLACGRSLHKISARVCWHSSVGVAKRLLATSILQACLCPTHAVCNAFLILTLCSVVLGSSRGGFHSTYSTFSNGYHQVAIIETTDIIQKKCKLAASNCAVSSAGVQNWQKQAFKK